MRRRKLLASAGAALVAAAAIAVVAVSGGGSGGGVARAAAATSTATVAAGRLSSQVYDNGTLGYAAQPDGTPYAIVNRREGAFTSLPQSAHVVRCGEALYRVDDVPVLLLCGAVPAWRSLHAGMEGPDVRQLNRNLVALGYATADELDPRSGSFGSATAYALGKLQADRGLDRTDTLELGDAVFLPGPLRIAKVTAALGAG
ncbi:MAG TPA: peptidoglycan-binding domain-containing protein, partial [Conexibacter sp.]|nr:peptidoglycan-binding domain-containing protein [Conexibacter sp.]